MSYIIGIDPGLDGGIAFIGEGIITARVTPTVVSSTSKAGSKKRDFDMVAMAVLLQRYPVELIAIERVQAGAFSTLGGRVQGVTSIFSFGRGYGIWLGMLAALNLPYEIVSPQTWKAAILGGTAKDKAAAAAFARGRFPGLSLKATARCTKDHDGICDAVCIAEFARRQVVGAGNERSVM